MKDYYTYPQEVWDAAKCEKMAKRIVKDGYGSSFPVGYLGSNQPNGGKWGVTTYNGGCVIDDKHYKGEIRPLPKVAEGFEIVQHLAWGYFIEKNGT